MLSTPIKCEKVYDPSIGTNTDERTTSDNDVSTNSSFSITTVSNLKTTNTPTTRVCLICNDDKQVGINYGVISCKSCGIFYGRHKYTDTHNNNLVCLNMDDSCSLERVDGKTRCSKCRFTKYRKLSEDYFKKATEAINPVKD